MLVINDFSPFANMSEGEFYDYFKDKCSIGTNIKKVYRLKKEEHEILNNLVEDVRADKKPNRKRKKAKSDTDNS